MNLYKTKMIIKKYREYDRYTVYSIYQIIYDKSDNEIGIKFLYNTTSPPKDRGNDE